MKLRFDMKVIELCNKFDRIKIILKDTIR